MSKPLNLPADLIKDWARRQTAASAKLEGRELPADYVRPRSLEEFLSERVQANLMPPGTASSWHPGILMIPNELKLP